MIKSILKIIFPPKCILCGKILDFENDIEICDKCYGIIPFLKDTAETGSNKFYIGEFCDGVVCLCQYSGVIKESIMRFKFFEKSGYYRAFARLLAEKLKKVTKSDNFDIIASVPLYKRKQNSRGYNQSFLISKELSRITGITEGSRALTRIRDTASQSLLNKEKRQKNIKDAFEVVNPEKIKGKNILLIDDILTTGNTLSECSRVLKEAGAKKVVSAVIASGRK